MSQETRIPLPLVTVTCSACGEQATALEVNQDKARFHLVDGTMVRFPKAGLTEAEVGELGTMFLRCECCQEDHEEQRRG